MAEEGGKRKTHITGGKHREGEGEEKERMNVRLCNNLKK